MKRTMHVEVVSNEEYIYSGEASFIVVSTYQGELGIYPGHTPIMSLLKPGALRIVIPTEQKEELIALSGGLIEVQPERVTILSDVAIRSEALDKERAAQSKQLAEEKLKLAASDARQKAHAEAALAAAIAELKALDYIKLHHQ
ncbi:MAG: F0F1 ATP synthase subunit epsilon [Neisseriaceae bacterium]